MKTQILLPTYTTTTAVIEPILKNIAEAVDQIDLGMEPKSHIAKHTNYFLINESGKLEMVTYAPEQDYSGRRDSDQYSIAQGLFVNDISHDLWLTEVKCHRVVGTPSGLQTLENLYCKIVAKQQFDWDMSKPLGKRQSNLKKSNKWDECLLFYRNSKK